MRRERKWRITLAGYRMNIAIGMITLLQPLGACAGPTVEMPRQPEFPEVMVFKSISVGAVAGEGGKIIAKELENLVSQARVKDLPVFRMVRPGEQADGMVTGDVLEASVSDERYAKTNSVCDRYEALPSDASTFRKLFGKNCASQHEVQVPCLRRTARFALSLHLTDTRNSQVVLSDSIVQVAKDEACQDESRPLASGEVLLAQARSAVMARIRAAIVPGTVRVPLDLMERDAAVGEAYRQRFDGALRFAKEERLDRACAIFRDIGEALRATSLAINYNLGFCEEVEGNVWNADMAYKQADRLSIEPVTQITRGLERTRLAIKRLDMQGKVRPDLVSPVTPTRPTAPPSQPILPTRVAGDSVIPPELLLEDKRAALVIGNARYLSASPLTNPGNDAADVAASLRRLKFDVVHIQDARLVDLDRGLDEFSRRLKPGGVALVFYAGHGVQLNGENWLMPVDISTKIEERDVSRQALGLNAIMERLDAVKSAVNIVVLDACRDNPFARSLKRSGAGAGLATVQAPSGTLIAYATAPGKTAADGDGRNSPFTRALVKALELPNLKLEDVFKIVGRTVMQDTGGVQVPWNNSSVTGDFYFSARRSDVPATILSGVPAVRDPGMQRKLIAGSASGNVADRAGDQAQVASLPVVENPRSNTSKPERSVKEFCADRPNFISRNQCEHRQCLQPQYRDDPGCAGYLRKSDAPAF